MAISKWFSKGYDAVKEYSKELEEKRANYGKNIVFNLYLKDGESRVVRFITSEPIAFREHYVPNAKGKKSYTCLEGLIDEKTGQRMECPFCSAGNKPSFRGAFLVIDRTEDKWESGGEVKTAKNQIKLFKQGIKVLKVLDKMSSKRNIKEWDIEITRTGGGTDTQYNFIPEEKKELTKEELDMIETFKDGKTLEDKITNEIAPLTMKQATDVLLGKAVDTSKDSEEDEEDNRKAPSYSDDDNIGF